MATFLSKIIDTRLCRMPDASFYPVSLSDRRSYDILREERRGFTEAPIPGYMGYVPKQEEYKLGSRYGQWTRYAYSDSLRSMLNEEKLRNESIPFGSFSSRSHVRTTTWPLSDGNNNKHWPITNTNKGKFGSVYNKRLGMVPNYTGFVPQRRFDFGCTYSDSSRSLPVCFDTAGYSTGKYNNPGPPITRTVIPVRI